MLDEEASRQHFIYIGSTDFSRRTEWTLFRLAFVSPRSHKRLEFLLLRTGLRRWSRRLGDHNGTDQQTHNNSDTSSIHGPSSTRNRLIRQIRIFCSLPNCRCQPANAVLMLSPGIHLFQLMPHGERTAELA